jgi:hypothetical protein
MGTRLRLAMVFLALAANPVFAEETPPAPTGSVALLERQQGAASRLLEAAIRRADSLFGGDQVYDAHTGSYLQLGGGYTFKRDQDGGEEGFRIVRAKVNLPRTSERLQLLVDRNLENVTRSFTDRAAAAAAGQGGTDDATFVGLRGVGVENTWARFTADAGVRPRGLSPDPYARIRVEKVFGPGEWKVPLSETLLWRRSDEASASTQLGLYRPLRDDVILSLFSTATWRSRTEAWDLSEVATLTRRIEDRALLSAEFGVYGSSAPAVQVNAWSIALRYRRKLGRDWLLGELRPQLIYPRSNGFQPVPSLTVSVEVLFGQGRLPTF